MKRLVWTTAGRSRVATLGGLPLSIKKIPLGWMVREVCGRAIYNHIYDAPEDAEKMAGKLARKFIMRAHRDLVHGSKR